MKKNIWLCVLAVIFYSCDAGNKKMDDKPVPAYAEQEISVIGQTDTVAGESDVADDSTAYYKNMIRNDQSPDIIHIIEEIDMGDRSKRYFIANIEGSSQSSFLDYLFVSDDNYEMTRYYIGYGDHEYYPADIIMKNIPGYKLENSLVAVGDYNNDGNNEILGYLFGGSSFYFCIDGLDEVKNELINYCTIEFFIRPSPEFSPVEFIKYKGIDGFKILRPLDYLGRELPKFDVPNYPGCGWIFYHWDGDTRKFIEFEEVDPKYVEN
jgi:hypothetical protein